MNKKGTAASNNSRKIAITFLLLLLAITITSPTYAGSITRLFNALGKRNTDSTVASALAAAGVDKYKIEGSSNTLLVAANRDSIACVLRNNKEISFHYNTPSSPIAVGIYAIISGGTLNYIACYDTIISTEIVKYLKVPESYTTDLSKYQRNGFSIVTPPKQYGSVLWCHRTTDSVAAILEYSRYTGNLIGVKYLSHKASLYKDIVAIVNPALVHLPNSTSSSAVNPANEAPVKKTKTNNASEYLSSIETMALLKKDIVKLAKQLTDMNDRTANAVNSGNIKEGLTRMESEVLELGAPLLKIEKTADEIGISYPAGRQEMNQVKRLCKLVRADIPQLSVSLGLASTGKLHTERLVHNVEDAEKRIKNMLTNIVNMGDQVDIAGKRYLQAKNKK